MKPMEDVWKDISSLPPFHHPSTTHHFQDFFAPTAPHGGGGSFQPPPPPPQLPQTTTTILSLSTSNESEDYSNKRFKPNSSLMERSPVEYTEKFKRLMKNRESAARSRARKQARADELEQEVSRLAKENAKLKKLQKELCLSSTAQFPKKPRLHRSKSALF